MAVCIDLFAGPGVLGEGFAKQGLSIGISIEKEAVECETLFRRKLHKLLLDAGRAADTLQLYDNSLSKNHICEIFPDLSVEADRQVAQLELPSGLNRSY